MLHLILLCASSREIFWGAKIPAREEEDAVADMGLGANGWEAETANGGGEGENTEDEDSCE